MVQVVCQPLTHELCASEDCRMCSPAYLRHKITELGAQFYPEEVKFSYLSSRSQLNNQIRKKKKKKRKERRRGRGKEEEEKIT